MQSQAWDFVLPSPPSQKHKGGVEGPGDQGVGSLEMWGMAGEQMPNSFPLHLRAVFSRHLCFSSDLCVLKGGERE